MGDTDFISKDEFDDSHILAELVKYTHALAPQFSAVIDALQNGEAVEVRSLQELISQLHDEVAKHFDDEGSLDDESLKLEDVLANVGGQL